ASPRRPRSRSVLRVGLAYDGGAALDFRKALLLFARRTARTGSVRLDSVRFAQLKIHVKSKSYQKTSSPHQRDLASRGEVREDGPRKYTESRAYTSAVASRACGPR